MKHYPEFALRPPLPERFEQSVDAKTGISMELVRELADTDIKDDVTSEAVLLGEVPRLTPYDIKHLPDGARLVRLPTDLVEEVARTSTHDRGVWNTPEAFLGRLVVSNRKFKPPVKGNSQVMDRLQAKGKIVGFSNLRIKSPVPKKDRHSRTRIHDTLGEHNIMGMARMPLALGSVPDVGSVLGYITVAQANGMAFIARDKVLSDTGKQVEVTKRVINSLEEMELPDHLYPREAHLQKFWEVTNRPHTEFNPYIAELRYFEALRASWIANVGAAIEASPKGIERAQRLHAVGCKLLRIYSPEGGREIVSQVAALRQEFDGDPEVKIVAGQMMDHITALEAQNAGADALIIGVAGGSQCTTSKNAGIPVNTPNLLYELRGRVKIPIGIEGGGVGDHLMTAFALGASFLLKPGEIGMSIEGAGAKYMLKDPEGEYWMLYGGEASDSSKWWRDLLDTLGRPRFVEGEPGVRILPQDKHSMTTNINRLKQQIAIGLVFQRVASIEALHRRSCANIVEVTPEAADLSGAYGR